MTTEQEGQRAPSAVIRVTRRVGQVRELGLLVVLLLIFVGVAVPEPRFVAVNNLRDILLSVAIIAIVVVGETLVVLTRNVDLSVSAIIGLVAFVSGDLFKQHPGISIAVVIAIGCAIGLGLGLLNGLLVSYGGVPAIVVTLGTLYIYRGLDYAIAGGKQINAFDVPDRFLNLASDTVLGIPLLIILAAVIAAIFALLLRYTRLGRQVYAIGSNPEAARLAGIQRNRLVLLTFVISGLLSGFAGILWAARFATVDANAATGLELLVVASVVVGGVSILGGSGTILGAMLGAILLATIQDALNILNISPFWLQAFYGAAILLAVMLDTLIMRRLQRSYLTRRL
ncbi:MAG TPA: ABC transporter permease [Ktedonobacterales bacterium]|jgi:rhamnose transport system permease protein